MKESDRAHILIPTKLRDRLKIYCAKHKVYMVAFVSNTLKAAMIKDHSSPRFRVHKSEKRIGKSK